MVDPITLEVIRHRLKSIADEMLITLLKSAHSSIIKEGMDASTAIFDLNGETIAQSNSIPIHLGSLVPAISAILDKYPQSTMRDGDAYILNNPYRGGTHLPDVIIVAPVYYNGDPVAIGLHNSSSSGSWRQGPPAAYLLTPRRYFRRASSCPR